LAVFVRDEVLLDVSFAAARARLARLTDGGLLLGTSQAAYRDGTAGTARVGVAGLSRLVRVQVCELAATGDSAGLAIRWEAAAPGGGLFPVLDADIRLAAAGDGMTLLTLAGSYRPPFGPVGEMLDRAVLHHVAAATVENFVSQVARGITGHNGQAETAAAGPSLPPGAG
jgi:hypothetical protein